MQVNKYLIFTEVVFTDAERDLFENNLRKRIFKVA